MVPVGRPHPNPCSRPDLAARLVEFDELAAAERAALSAHARACPSCAPALRLLEAADRHLAGLHERRASDACPSSEELFDFARAPGAHSLDPARAAAVGAHVERCAECSDLLSTLAARPPSPLILDPLPTGRAFAGIPDAWAPPRDAHRRPARLLRLAPLAAAAGLVVAVSLWRLGGDLFGPQAAVPGDVVFPEAEVLRGDQGGALLWPRGALLAPPPAGGGLSFELDLPERAGAWRVRVFARHEDPFVEGRELLALSGEGPLASADALPPGAYTWEAWAAVDGLDVLLGRRDFDVRADADAAAELARLADRPEPERSSATLALLAARGYHADARAWARALPPSSGRDAFLARTPGR